MAGALAEWRNDAMAAVYPELNPERTSIVLVEMGPEVLSAFAPRLRRSAERARRRRGVELRLRTAVAEVRPDGVQLKSGEFLPAGVVVWAAGVRVPEVVKEWGVPQGRAGRIQTDEYLRVPGVDGVFAAGDVAIGPSPLPQLAQPAIQGGRHAGRQIANLVAGKPLQQFHYHDKGTLATIGRRAAVAEIELPIHRSVRVTGTIAWFIWLFVHIVMLLGNRNRLATFVNLTTRYLAPSHRTNPIVGDVPIYQHRAPRERRSAQ
jgi:NADH dehydrogenase